MAKHPYGANTEMLILLAWLSTLDLPTQARKDREARPWEYPYRPSWDQSGLPGFSQELVREAIARALECFSRDPIYGPLFEALVRYRLTYVDFRLVGWAIELKDLADPSAGLFFSDDPYYSQRHESSEFTNEAEVFLQSASAHRPLSDRLRRLGTSWNSDVCRGALELQSFFGWYLGLAAWVFHMPFFLPELLRRSLSNVDWHVAAANVAPCSAHQVCRCAARAQQVPLAAIAEYLGEVFKATGDEVVSLGQQLPEPECMQALLLADLCRETTKAMRQYLMDSEAR